MRLPIFIGALSFIVVLSATDGLAQQSIFNVPSAEVSQPGATSLEFNSTFRASDPEYGAHLPRVTVGLGRNVELSSGVLNTEGRPFGENTALTIGAKWRPWASEQTGTSLTTSSMVLAPFRGSMSKGSVLSFAGLHQRVPRMGTRVSGGIFDATPHALKTTNLLGGWASVEQPLAGGFRFVTDWISGNHRIGAVTSGFGWSNRYHNIQFGYRVSNDVGRLNGFTARYGFQF